MASISKHHLFDAAGEKFFGLAHKNLRGFGPDAVELLQTLGELGFVLGVRAISQLYASLYQGSGKNLPGQQRFGNEAQDYIGLFAA